MVAWDEVTSPAVPVDYGDLAAEVLRRAVERSGMRKNAFTEALSRELSGTRRRRGQIHGPTLSKWLSGEDMPGMDVALASLQLGKVPYQRILEALDPWSSPEDRVSQALKKIEELEEVIRRLTAADDPPAPPEIKPPTRRRQSTPPALDGAAPTPARPRKR